MLRCARIVDGNSVLSLPVLLESMQPIARGDPEIVEAGRQVHVLQLAGRARGDVRWKTLGGSRLPSEGDCRTTKSTTLESYLRP